MNTKYIYGIAAIVVVLIGGMIWLNSSPKESTDQYGDNQQQQTTNQDNNQGDDQTAMTNTDPQDGCSEGTDFSQKDANGRFKPTTDISNKTAILETNFGKIEIQLYDKDAPKTVQNFVCLIQKGYYDSITFHRVAHGFVIQAGDPTGTGSGGTSIYGAKFEDELYADTASYKAGYMRGVVAMANSGANTNGSQFFILLSNAGLPHNYTIFGKVSAGMDVVDEIGAVPVMPKLGPEDGTPVEAVIINKATIK